MWGKLSMEEFVVGEENFHGGVAGFHKKKFQEQWKNKYEKVVSTERWTPSFSEIFNKLWNILENGWIRNKFSFSNIGCQLQWENLKINFNQFKLTIENFKQGNILLYDSHSERKYTENTEKAHIYVFSSFREEFNSQFWIESQLTE